MDYFTDYAEEMNIKCALNTRVRHADRIDGQWQIKTEQGTHSCDHLVIATGKTNIPRMVEKPGLESFRGSVIHSAEYKNGESYANKDVLVIGFGNSAGEIAICLHEHGARPALSVRSGVNIVPRDILGLSALAVGAATNALPPHLADKLNKPIVDLIIGDVRKLGFKKLPYGPKEQITKYGQIPLLDIGTVDLIRKGFIQVFDDVEKITGNIIHFKNGKEQHFDHIIMGTGYETGLEQIIDIDEARYEDMLRAPNKRQLLGKDNLYFSGYFVSPGGTLTTVGQDAEVISSVILG